MLDGIVFNASSQWLIKLIEKVEHKRSHNWCIATTFNTFFCHGQFSNFENVYLVQFGCVYKMFDDIILQLCLCLSFHSTSVVMCFVVKLNRIQCTNPNALCCKSKRYDCIGRCSASDHRSNCEAVCCISSWWWVFHSFMVIYLFRSSVPFR